MFRAALAPFREPWDNRGLTCLDFEKKVESEVAQSCPTLCDPMDCSLQGSSVHAIFQARVLERVAISFSRVGKATQSHILRLVLQENMVLYV